MHYLHENSEDGNLIHHRDGEVQGKTLREIVNGQPLPLSICFEILAYVADILTETDKSKLYHGHLCLDTVGLTAAGSVFITEYDPGKTESRISPEKQLTDISADSYALGLLLIALLAGHDNYKIPKDEQHHDDAIARIILSLSWQELAEQMWLENIQDFLVDTLSYFPTERPHPLDVANVLFELLPFTSGPKLKVFAAERIQPPPEVRSDVVPRSQPMDEWGAAEAIEAPVLRSVSIVPDSSQGAATGLWSRQKIADMFNGSLRPEEKARREVWKPKQFGEDQEPSDAFLTKSGSPVGGSAPPPPPALPDLPDLPPLSGNDDPNPIDNPDFFVTSQASLSSPEAVSDIDAKPTYELNPAQDIPPPPSFSAPPAPSLPPEPAQLPSRPNHAHPDTAPLRSSAGAQSAASDQQAITTPPEANVFVSQSSPSIGVNLKIDQSLPPAKPPSKTKWWLYGGLTVSMLMCVGIVGTMVRNKDILLGQITSEAVQTQEEAPKTAPEPPSEPAEVIAEPEAPTPTEPEAPPEPTPAPTPAPVPTPAPTTAQTPQPSSSPSASSGQAATPSPPPIPRAPRRENRPPRRPTPEPTPTPPPTPEPAQASGSIRATITGINGRISCGDGQQMEINNSVVMEFSSQQACRVDSDDGLRGALIIRETRTYTCISNNGAVECR